MDIVAEKKKSLSVDSLPAHYRQVLGVIGEGMKNPTPAKTISKLTGFDTRFIATIVNRLILTYGFAIGSSRRAGNYGYFFITNENEREEVIQTLEGQSLEIHRRAQALKECKI